MEALRRSLDSDWTVAHIPTGASSLSDGYLSVARSDQIRDLTSKHTEQGIKCTRYEEMLRLVFSDHKTTSLTPNRKVRSVMLPHFPDQRLRKRGKRGASVVIIFWLLSRSRHMSHYVKSVPSDQQTRYAQQAQYGPKEKASSPASSPHTSRATYTRSRLSCPFPRPHRSETIHPDAHLVRNCSTSQMPQPPRRKSFAKTVASTVVTV